MRYHICLLLPFVLSGCITLSGNYQIDIIAPDGTKLPIDTRAQGTGIYTTINAACRSVPGATIIIKNTDTGKELTRESPHHCKDVPLDAQFTGETATAAADKILQHDVLRRLTRAVNETDACSKIDAVTTTVVAAIPPGSQSAQKDETQLCARYGCKQERWDVAACKKRFAFKVLLSHADDGGTDFLCKRIDDQGSNSSADRIQR